MNTCAHKHVCFRVAAQLPPYLSPNTLETFYFPYPTSNHTLSQCPSPSLISLPLAETLAITCLDSCSHLLCPTSFALKSQVHSPKEPTENSRAVCTKGNVAISHEMTHVLVLQRRKHICRSLPVRYMSTDQKHLPPCYL